MIFTDDEITIRLMDAYLKARQHERKNLSQIEFEINLEENLFKLKSDLKKRNYKQSKLISFIIEKPVKREVYAPHFRDRVISHFLFDLINPIFEPTFIYDSYSCRKGKGTLFGIERAEHHIRSCTNNYKDEGYCLKLDISGYFMSIDRIILHNILTTSLEKFRYRKQGNGIIWDDIVDFELVYYIIDIILNRDPLENVKFIGDIRKLDELPPNKLLKNSPKNVGLIIGDLISQLFSNIYLSYFDNYVKRELKCKHYCRYVDDALIIHKDKTFLKSLIPKIEEFLNKELHLNLNRKKIKIIKVGQNIFFLGACLRPHRKYIINRSVKSFKNKIYLINQTIYRESYLKQDEIFLFRSIINSYVGYFSHYTSKTIRTKILKKNWIQKYYKLNKSKNKVEICSGIQVKKQILERYLI